MNAATATADAGLIELPRLAPGRSRMRLIAQGLSLLLLGLVLYQLFRADPAQLRAALPDSPAFLIVLLAMYLALPVADWVIFRRLWNLPLAGFPLLLTKRINNELLVAYSGEVSFYLWAKSRAGLTAAPFGTIKDVNILSALAGNLLALALILIAAPLAPQLMHGGYARAAIASAALMMAGSLIVWLLSRRLFTLSRRDLAFVLAVHVARLIAGVLLCALLWSIALPRAPFSFWLALAIVRLLVARLPLLPNKELLFATIAVFLIGHDAEINALIAMTSTAMLLLHLLFGGTIALWGLVAGERLGGAVPQEARG